MFAKKRDATLIAPEEAKKSIQARAKKLATTQGIPSITVSHHRAEIVFMSYRLCNPLNGGAYGSAGSRLADARSAKKQRMMGRSFAPLLARAGITEFSGWYERVVERNGGTTVKPGVAIASLLVPRVTVSMTRIGRGKLDYDGNVAAFKHLRDGVADALGFKNDERDEIEWRYEPQESGDWAVRIVVSA